MLLVAPPNELVDAPNPGFAPKPVVADESKPPNAPNSPAGGVPNAGGPLVGMLVVELKLSYVVPFGIAVIVGSLANNSW